MDTHFDGDDTLSGSDRHLWSLCYSTLMRFACVTIFKVRGPDARYRINKEIVFYVPGQHPKAAEVKAYLEEDLRHEIMAPGEIEGCWTYGTTVRVVYFSGIDPYLTHEETAPLIEKAVENFMEMLKTRQRKVQ
jgi:hypothetical protein